MRTSFVGYVADLEKEDVYVCMYHHRQRVISGSRYRVDISPELNISYQQKL
jgi:hypothetical protein